MKQLLIKHLGKTWSKPQGGTTFFSSETPGLRIRQDFSDFIPGYQVMELHFELEPKATLNEAIFSMTKADWLSFESLEFPNSIETFLANGYQCWSESRFFDRTSILRSESHDAQRYFGDDQIWNYSVSPGRGHSWSYSILTAKERNYFYGCLTEDRSSGVFDINLIDQTIGLHLDFEGFDPLRWLTLLKKKRQCLIGAWVMPKDSFDADVPISEVADAWLNLMHEYETTPRTKGNRSKWNAPVTGYTSWYNKFTEIDEQWLQAHVQSVSEKTNWKVFQVDDGYQNKIGDWLSRSNGFPNGIEPVLKEAAKNGLLPGIWMAPFVAIWDSELAKAHPEWIVRDHGSNLTAGDFAHWGGKFYVLDHENIEFKNYISEVVKRFSEMGVKFIKADFLYAAAMKPRNGKTRGELSSMAHQWFYEVCLDRGISFLSCGAPLSSAYRRCDFARIGPDISLDWEYKPLLGTSSREKPSVRASIINTVTRSFLNGSAFWNDPDVVILRKENNSLTQSEKEALVTINRAFGGLIFSSDSPELYGLEELKLLEIMQTGADLESPIRIDVERCEPFQVSVETKKGKWKIMSSSTAEVKFERRL
jgi:alpha-galactosidase